MHARKRDDSALGVQVQLGVEDVSAAKGMHHPAGVLALKQTLGLVSRTAHSDRVRATPGKRGDLHKRLWLATVSVHCQLLVSMWVGVACRSLTAV